MIDGGAAPAMVDVVMGQSDGSYRRMTVCAAELGYDATLPSMGILPYYDGKVLLMTSPVAPGMTCVPVLDKDHHMPIAWFTLSPTTS